MEVDQAKESGGWLRAKEWGVENGMGGMERRGVGGKEEREEREEKRGGGKLREEVATMQTLLVCLTGSGSEQGYPEPKSSFFGLGSQWLPWGKSLRWGGASESRSPRE